LRSESVKQEGRAFISAVHGLGGIGKTTVARWLVWRPEIKKRFPNGRIWITLGSEPPDAIAVISDCVSQLDPSFKTRATVEAARGDLAALLQDASVLLVIDDVWPGKSVEVAKALMVPSPGSRFLMTTRFPQLADDFGAAEFSLDEMNIAQATELVARALNRQLSHDEQPLAERLSEIVGGHPLALELAAARIKEGRPWKRLLDDLSAELVRLEALEEWDDDLLAAPIGSETRKRRASVRASLLLSIRYLNREGQRLFAWLGIVPEDAIITPKMAGTLWLENEERAARRLRELASLGLMSTKAGGYGIHDLMHDLARELLTASDAPKRAGDFPGFGLPLQAATQQLIERYRVKTTGNLTRSGLDWTAKYPATAAALAKLPVKSAYLDGELCGVRPDGVTSFALMQEASDAGLGGLVYYAFDLLELDGENIADRPLLERKERLAALLKNPPAGIVYSEHEGGDGEAFRRAACSHGLEGMVSKRTDRPYLPGDRGAWAEVTLLPRRKCLIRLTGGTSGSRFTGYSLTLTPRSWKARA
jgi:hypothetical protein